MNATAAATSLQQRQRPQWWGNSLHNHRQLTPGELLAGNEGRSCPDSCQRLARAARTKARHRGNSANLATAVPSPGNRVYSS